MNNHGYNVGSTGLHDYSRLSAPSDDRENNASELQQRAESEGIDALRYREQLHVGNRLLAIHDGDIDKAAEWFSERFGEDYNDEETRRYLRSIKRKYSDLDYSDTDIDEMLI